MTSDPVLHLLAGPLGHFLVILVPVVGIDLGPLGYGVVKVQGQLTGVILGPALIEAAEAEDHVVGRNGQVRSLDTCVVMEDNVLIL